MLHTPLMFRTDGKCSVRVGISRLTHVVNYLCTLVTSTTYNVEEKREGEWRGDKTLNNHSSWPVQMIYRCFLSKQTHSPLWPLCFWQVYVFRLISLVFPFRVSENETLCCHKAVHHSSVLWLKAIYRVCHKSLYQEQPKFAVRLKCVILLQ
jgi:hypothetical protein